MITIRPVTSEDLVYTYVNGKSYIKQLSFSESIKQAAILVNSGFSVTILEDDIILAIVGMVVAGKHGQCWARITNNIFKHKLKVSKTIKQLILDYAESQQLTRIDVVVEKFEGEKAETLKWPRILGLEYETTMKQWGFNGVDVLIYSKIIQR